MTSLPPRSPGATFSPFRSRRRTLLGLAPALAALGVPQWATARPDTLVLSGPGATVSFPLIHMMESGALSSLAKNESASTTTCRTPG